MPKYVKVIIEPWPEYSGGWRDDKYEVAIREYNQSAPTCRAESTGKVRIWYTKTRWGAKLYAWRIARQWRRQEQASFREEYILDY